MDPVEDPEQGAAKCIDKAVKAASRCMMPIQDMSAPCPPLFPWLDDRGAGVLVHPTSLPGDLGIGKFGREARRLVDFLQAGGYRYWQVCPLGPTGFGDSPYQCFSAIAGNPYLIDLYPMVSHGLLAAQDLKPLQQLPHGRVDYGALYTRMAPLLDKLAQALIDSDDNLPGYGGFSKFREAEADWLRPYAAFRALKAHFAGKPWFAWPKEVRTYAAFCSDTRARELQAAILREEAIQYLFRAQWRELRAYANERGIRIIGDVPIFVALDSADAWADPDLFQLNAKHQPTAVAGVPPDYFSRTGQLWGNPLYRWDRMQANDYAWWKQRLAANFAGFDVLRLDHFRGFAAYWAVPASHKDARKGKWQKGPGIDFFKALAKAFPDSRMIAEDLGEITPDVDTLRAATGLPGMAVLQFAFGGDAENPYLPHNIDKNCVVYPGTHDNDTTLGWYQAQDESVRDHFRRYLAVDGRAPQWELLRAAYRSSANLAIIPMQDLLNLDSEARLNTPGLAAGNWAWRYTDGQLDNLWRESAGYLYALKELYGR